MTFFSIVCLALSLSVGLIFFALFCWAAKSGQFDDIEEAKYEMFRDGEDEDGS